MKVSNFEIADIIYRIESEVVIKGLQNSHFSKFKVISSTKANIFHRFISLPRVLESFHPLNKEEKRLLSHCFIYPDRNLDNPILSYPLVRDRLRECLRHIDFISLEINSLSLSIFDFAHNRVDTFYTYELKKMLEDSHVSWLVFAQFLSSFSAAMIHSSAVVINNVTALFLAPGSGGKTTVSKLSTGYPVLCDDQVIIRKEGKGFKAHSTPWGMLIDNSLNASLGGFFLLEQAEQFELIPLKPVYILNYFWNEHFAYRFYLPKSVKSQHFQFLYDIACSVPTYRLRFPRNYIDWNAIEKAISK